MSHHPSPPKKKRGKREKEKKILPHFIILFSQRISVPFLSDQALGGYSHTWKITHGWVTTIGKTVWNFQMFDRSLYCKIKKYNPYCDQAHTYILVPAAPSVFPSVPVLCLSLPTRSHLASTRTQWRHWNSRLAWFLAIPVLMRCPRHVLSAHLSPPSGHSSLRDLLTLAHKCLAGHMEPNVCSIGVEPRAAGKGFHKSQARVDYRLLPARGL